MRFFSIPALVIGIALAIGFFKVYGALTRPDVPAPVARVVAAYAPGVAIGTPAADARHAVAGMTWVRHVGWVGLPGSSASTSSDGYAIEFARVRLFADDRTRALENPDLSRTRIDAVEMDTGVHGAYSELLQQMTMLFRAVPREGCVLGAEGRSPRAVHWWMTANERGGVAVIAPLNTLATDSVTTGTPMLTQVVAFVGPFRGGHTLRADFDERSCAQLAPES